eukprot:6186873-Pleurochrysis_carterae.AAC.3
MERRKDHLSCSGPHPCKAQGSGLRSRAAARDLAHRRNGAREGSRSLRLARALAFAASLPSLPSLL